MNQYRVASRAGPSRAVGGRWLTAIEPVANAHLADIDRLNGVQIARVDLARHRMTPRAERDGIALLQPLDVPFRPAHHQSLCGRPRRLVEGVTD